MGCSSAQHSWINQPEQLGNTVAAACPDALKPDLLHRLTAKEAELAKVIRLASQVEVIGLVAQDWLRPGELTALHQEVRSGKVGDVEIAVELPDDWMEMDGKIGPTSGAVPSDSYPSVYRPLHPAKPALRVTV